MKRTIKEICDLIREKRENIKKDLTATLDKDIKCRLLGQFEAYTDILALIESSGVLEEEQVKNIALEMASKQALSNGEVERDIKEFFLLREERFDRFVDYAIEYFKILAKQEVEDAKD